MTTTQTGILAIWLVSGVFATVGMMRKGHRHWIWIVFGVLLGPLAWLVFRERTEADAPHVEELVQGTVRPGLHLLAGIDGSSAAEQAVTRAIEMLGASLGRVTLATVIDYDTDEDRDERTTEPAAWDALHAAAAGLAASGAGEALLVGPPVDALLRFAAENGADLVVVGPRGRGLSKRVLGSVCTELVARSTIPVLVIGEDGAAGARRR